MTITIELWGVRGSLPTPGPRTARTGGNTSCVEVRCGDTRLILDAGSGIRELGDRMLREGEREITLLVSHTHWDHIQGLPFFVPLYLPATKLTVIGPGSRLGLRGVLAQQMTSPVFPVQLDELASRLVTREVAAGARFSVGSALVTTAALHHPGGCLGYRIEHQGQCVVYATDNEHRPELDPGLLSLSRGADVLIYDAQYTPDEYPNKIGWGHSTYAAGAALARAAGVRELVLFHHDPRRTDDQVDAIEREARALFPRSRAAREGDRIVIDPRALAA